MRSFFSLRPASDRYLNKAELAALLLAARDDRYPLSFEFLALQYLLAARVSEACLLRYENLAPKYEDAKRLPRAVYVPTLKGRLRGEPMHAGVRDGVRSPPDAVLVPVLAHYSWVRKAFDPRVRPRGWQTSPWLFPSKRSRVRPLARNTAMEIFSRVRDAAGLRDVYTSHALRNSADHHLAAAGCPRGWRARFLRCSPGEVMNRGGRLTDAYGEFTLRDWQPYVLSGALDVGEPRAYPFSVRF